MKRDTVPLSKPIPVKLPPEILKRVDALAKRIGEPRSTVMRIAMRVGLDSLETVFEADPKKVLSSLASPSGSDEYRPLEKTGKGEKKATRPFDAEGLAREIRDRALEEILSSPETDAAAPERTSQEGEAAEPAAPSPQSEPTPASRSAQSTTTGRAPSRKRNPRNARKP